MKLTKKLKKKIDKYFNKISAEDLYETMMNEYGFIESDNVPIYQQVNEILKTNFQSELTAQDWEDISRMKLSEDFINRFSRYLDWGTISATQPLSEEFMAKHLSKLNMVYISRFQKLSEYFIEIYANKLDWINISAYQKLSEKFIEKFSDRVYWYCISRYQVLSEDFIRKFQSKVDWTNISAYQKLSEPFIKDFAKEVNMLYVRDYQDISKDTLKEINPLLEYDFKPKKYRSTEEKKCAVEKTGLYECYRDYFIAYKAIRADRYSLFNFQYKYEKGKIYKSNCDITLLENSFGLNVGTFKHATDYGKPFSGFETIVVRCKVKYEDVGRVVHGGDKIRCFRIEILD